MKLRSRLIILACVALMPMVVTRGAEAVTRGEPPGEEPTAIAEVGQLARAVDDAAMAIRERDRE